MIDLHRMRRGAAVFLLAALLAACNGSPPPPVFSKSVNVGVSPNTPGWGSGETPAERQGFDQDLTNWLGSRLDFNPVPVSVVTKDRESYLERGSVTLVIATYSITDKRKKRVAFAGPYAMSQQGVMVRAADKKKYRKISDLRGKTVCATAGSTSVAQLHDGLGFPVSIRERYLYSQCLHDLKSGQVDAVSTDQLLLYGLAQTDSDVYVPPDIIFGQQERFGVGLPKGDTAKCKAVTKKLREFIAGGYWDTFFARNLPGVSPVGHKPDPNNLDRC